MSNFQRVDGFLSRRAQDIYPGALVWCEELEGGGETWRMERPDQPEIGLGINFQSAKQAIEALLRAHQAKGGKP